MNNIWNELSEESKDYVRKVFNEYESVCLEDLVRMNLMDDLFGKENLKPKLQIKTWDDVITNIVVPNNFPDVSDVFSNYVIVRDLIKCPDVIKKKLEATYRIAILIELGYGGMITDEEWDNPEIPKYCIHWSNNLKEFYYDFTFGERELLTFHTPEQQRSFFENNKQLCKDYYMINY